MEEFLLPVAIPHAEVRADKEILFLRSCLSSFPPCIHCSSTVFYSVFATIAQGLRKVG